MVRESLKDTLEAYQYSNDKFHPTINMMNIDICKDKEYKDEALEVLGFEILFCIGEPESEDDNAIVVWHCKYPEKNSYKDGAFNFVVSLKFGHLKPDIYVGGFSNLVELLSKLDIFIRAIIGKT